ncbi:hypothetical protein HK097_011558 [Rhizophlyctis rosea]|uniref:Uncharacterized protein n=1 Tax=Rhizophlyctis rosea TaxID=64517 RepID=A0AAD5X1T2_9FUNG|nr:hypothetical protein HK097_011558 [Rhizophlyctis rosea]
MANFDPINQLNPILKSVLTDFLSKIDVHPHLLGCIAFCNIFEELGSRALLLILQCLAARAPKAELFRFHYGLFTKTGLKCHPTTASAISELAELFNAASEKSYPPQSESSRILEEEEDGHETSTRPKKRKRISATTWSSAKAAKAPTLSMLTRSRKAMEAANAGEEGGEEDEEATKRDSGGAAALAGDDTDVGMNLRSGRTRAKEPLGQVRNHEAGQSLALELTPETTMRKEWLPMGDQNFAPAAETSHMIEVDKPLFNSLEEQVAHEMDKLTVEGYFIHYKDDLIVHLVNRIRYSYQLYLQGDATLKGVGKMRPSKLKGQNRHRTVAEVLEGLLGKTAEQTGSSNWAKGIRKAVQGEDPKHKRLRKVSRHVEKEREKITIHYFATLLHHGYLRAKGVEVSGFSKDRNHSCTVRNVHDLVEGVDDLEGLGSSFTACTAFGETAFRGLLEAKIRLALIIVKVLRQRGEEVWKNCKESTKYVDDKYGFHTTRHDLNVLPEFEEGEEGLYREVERRLDGLSAARRTRRRYLDRTAARGMKKGDDVLKEDPEYQSLLEVERRVQKAKTSWINSRRRKDKAHAWFPTRINL